MSLRKSLRRSLRSSYKVKSSDEGQVKPDSAKMGTNERARNCDVTGYLAPDDVALPSGGVTLEASNSSFESHDDVMAAGAYQSSESEDDLAEGDRLDEATCPDNALYEFIFRACALMALENEELKNIIEHQQQIADKKEKEEEGETAAPKTEAEGGSTKRGKKEKVRGRGILS